MLYYESALMVARLQARHHQKLNVYRGYIMTLSHDEQEKALNTWFTPSQPAKKNYVGRGHLDKVIERAFSRKGNQVLIYGKTGAGKTSLVFDNLSTLNRLYGTQYIRIQVSELMTIESFVADVAQALNLVREVNHTVSDSKNNKGGGKLSFKWLSFQGETSVTNNNSKVVEEYTGNDDFNIIKKVLLKRNTILFIDDMERMQDETLRTRLAEIAKNMSDESADYYDSYAKIIFVGIASTADELMKADISLTSRLSTIEVPYLEQSESIQILKQGWNRAELISNDEQMVQVAHTASGIGHIVHELGQNIGYSTLDDGSNEIKDEYIDNSIKDVFTSNSLKYRKTLDLAKNKIGTKINMRNTVLYVMAESDAQSLPLQDILTAVNKVYAPKVKQTNSISPILSQLKDSTFNNILSSDNRNSWAFSDPMFKAYVRAHIHELEHK